MVYIKFEKVSKEKRKFDTYIKMPLRKTKGSAAYDIYSNETVTIQPGEKYAFWTDVKINMSSNAVAIINVRSSMGIKKDLALANTQGWIDSDYYNNPDNEGNVIICLKNLNKTEPITVNKGDAIGQIMFVKYLTAVNCNSDACRKGGIGSTGK